MTRRRRRANSEELALRQARREAFKLARKHVLARCRHCRRAPGHLAAIVVEAPPRRRGGRKWAPLAQFDGPAPLFDTKTASPTEGGSP
jgi:hypothetical protein